MLQASLTQPLQANAEKTQYFALGMVEKQKIYWFV